MTKIIIRDSEAKVQHDATSCFDIVIGEGCHRLNVSVARDGWVQVRAMDGDLEARPQANNTLLVRAIPYRFPAED